MMIWENLFLDRGNQIIRLFWEALDSKLVDVTRTCFPKKAESEGIHLNKTKHVKLLVLVFVLEKNKKRYNQIIQTSSLFRLHVLKLAINLLAFFGRLQLLDSSMSHA